MSNISNLLGQVETTSNDVNDNISKQECKALKELQEHQYLVIRKADKSNNLVIMAKDCYCDTRILKHHLNTSTYQKLDSNRDHCVFSNLKLLIKKYKSCLTNNEMKYILNSNWKSSNFYVSPKVHKSKNIIKKK